MRIENWCFSYIRMSTSQQTEGDSERRQLEETQAYADAIGKHLDTRHRDLGVSAASGKHQRVGAMSGFLALIGSGEVIPGDILLIEAIDRLSRERFHDAYALFSRILKAGVLIHTLEDRVTYTAENYDAIERIIPLVVKITAAHDYSRRLSGRLLPAKAKALERARANKTPSTKRCPAWLRVVDNRFEVIDDRAATIRQIFEYAASGIGAPTIAARLNQAAVPQFDMQGQGIRVNKHKAASQWETEYISKILTSSAVVGIFQPLKRRIFSEDERLNGKMLKNGEPILEYYPAVIDLAVFNRVQEIRKRQIKGSNRGSVTGQAKAHNLFSGLAHCKKCGGPMSFVTSVNKKKQMKAYFYCKSYLRKNGCDASGTINALNIERTMLGYLNLISHDIALAVSMRQQDQASVREADALTLEITRQESRLAAFVGGDEELSVPLLKACQALSEAILINQKKLTIMRRRMLELESANRVDIYIAEIDALADAAEKGGVEARMKIRTSLRAMVEKVLFDLSTKTIDIHLRHTGNMIITLPHDVMASWVSLTIGGNVKHYSTRVHMGQMGGITLTTDRAYHQRRRARQAA